MNNLYLRFTHRFDLQQTLETFKDLNFLRRRRIKNVPNFPPVLQIETTNDCSFSCIFCARREMKRPIQHMSFELVKRIIDESIRYGKRRGIYLYKDGDPLKNPEIDKMIRYCKEKNAADKIVIATSGLYLTEEIGKKIINSGLDEIWFSIDAFSKEVHNKVKGIDCYKIVYENARNFLKLKKDLKIKKPFTRVKFLITDVNKYEIRDFRNYWKRLADEVVIVKELSSWDGNNQRVNKDIKAMQSYKNIWDFSSVRYPCDRLWYLICVYSNGNITPCCEDWDEKCVIGNIRDKSIYQIWHGEELYNLRTLHIDGRYDEIALCKNCEIWKRRNMGDWYIRNKEKALRRNPEAEIGF